MSSDLLVPLRRSIFLVRNHWVMLDADLAQVYQVKTERLNEQVRRNLKRFPANYAFRLTREEFQNLIPQLAGSRWGGRRKPPYVFTEQGAVMVATVLRSARAVEMCIQVVEAFVTVSRAATVDHQIRKRLDELERSSRAHGAQLHVVFAALRKLLKTAGSRRPIGFLTPPKT